MIEMTQATANSLTHVAAAELRAAIRAGQWRAPTTGLAVGYAQANVVVLPAEYAAEFREFCRLNPRPCPLLAQTAPGDPCPREVAAKSDLRTDVPQYRVFRHGVPEEHEPTDIRDLWRDDLVGFLLGCSFTFEHALVTAGLPVRHLEEGRNVPMYRTKIDCEAAGRFSGPLVVSMRPYAPQQVREVTAITGQFPTMHGAPIHVGDPAKLGIGRLDRPDFGDAVTIRAGEVPVFWACGVTPQLALAAARPGLCITHSPGCMFLTDRTDESFRQIGPR